MRELFSDTPSPLPTEPEETVYVDPTLGEEPAHWRWEARAAQWRAMELAEHVFGGEVSARLSGRSGRTPFRGLLPNSPKGDLSKKMGRPIERTAQV